MTIDWNVVATIAAPIMSLFVGVIIDRVIESRPKVVSYIGHVSGINLTKTNPSLSVNTHSIVVRNAGNKLETNIRIGHVELPDYQIFPDIDHEVKTLPSGQKEIVIPKLVPKKQITITYLYFPPLTWQMVNTCIESDTGSVKILNVLPTVQLSKWMLLILWFLTGYGVIALIYSTYEFYKWMQ